MKKIRILAVNCAFIFTFAAGAPAAEFDILRSLRVEGTYAVLQGTVEVQGNEFTVGASTLVIKSGNVGIGTLTPTAALQLKAGTAAAGTAPLKLTSGTNLATPEAGALEFSSSHLYFTPAGTRFQLDQQTPVGGALASANIWVGNGSGQAAATAVTGDVTISNAGVTAITAGAVVNADLAGSITDDKLSTIATALKVSNSATTATNNNTASAIVARDAAGSFTAGTITAGLTGAASSNVLKAGDTMTGSLNFSGAASDITSASGEHISIVPGGAGNVGIGTTAPGAKLDVAGTSSFSQKAWMPYGSATSISGYTWTDAALNTTSIEIVNNQGAVTNLSPTLVFHRYGTGGPQFRLDPTGTNVLYLESANPNSSRNPNAYGGGTNNYFSRLHIDGQLSTVGNVGIGTTAPTGKLSVVSASVADTNAFKVDTVGGANAVFVSTNGNVGIGTAAPQAKLVIGADSSTPNAKLAAIGVERVSYAPGQNAAEIQFYRGANAQEGLLAFATRAQGGALTEKMRIDDSGNVGIGTTAPGAALDVNGVTNAATGFRVAGAAASGNYLRGNGTNFVASTIQAGDIASAIGGTPALTLGTANSAGSANTFVRTDATLLAFDATVPAALGTAAAGSATVAARRDHVHGAADLAGASTTGTLPVNKGGTGAATLTGILKGSGTSAVTAVTGTSNYVTKWSDANTIAASSLLYDNGTNIGIGTTSPSNKLHIKEASQTEFYGTDNSFPVSNLLLEGTDTGRTVGKGPSINFAFPANTDGTNVWTQARILATPNDNVTGHAIGRLYFQVRDNYDPGVGGSWNWRTGLMIQANGNVGVGSTAPEQKLTVAGSISQTGVLISSGTGNNYFAGNVGIGTSSPLATLSVGPGSISDVNIPIQISAPSGGQSWVGVNKNGAYGLLLGYTGNAAVLRQVSSSDPLQLWVNNTTVAQTILSNGNVGIGTAGPVAPLDIYRASAVNGPLLSLRSDFTAAGKYAMIRFGDQSQTTNYQKGAIIYEGVASSARGRFHIALNNDDTSNSVALTDAKLTIISDGSVGIGTTAPGALLQVSSAAYSAGTVAFQVGGGTITALTTGNVGIGTTSPGKSLDVVGAARVSSPGGAYIDILGVGDASNYSGLKLLSDEATDKYWMLAHRKAAGEVNNFAIEEYDASNYNQRFVIKPGGNVGIGTTSPGSILDVGGVSNTAFVQNLATWGLNAREQGLLIMPEGSVNDDGAGNLTFGNTVIIMNPLSGSYVRAAAGTYTLGTWGSLWMPIPPTGSRGGTVTPTVLAWTDADRNYDGRDRVLLAQRIGAGKIMTRFGNFANQTGTGGTYLTNGNVAIGTTTPTAVLDVRSGSYASNQNIGIQLGLPTGQWLSSFRIKSDGTGVVRTALDATDGTIYGTTNEALSISAQGRVGIGTTTPASPLNVVAANQTLTGVLTTAHLSLTTSDAPAANVGAAMGLGGYADAAKTTPRNFGVIAGRKENATDTDTSGYLSLSTHRTSTGLAEWMRITSLGYVGIGNTSPSVRLDVQAAGATSSDFAQIWRDSTGLVVASMTANGRLSTLQTMPGDNLGSHTATQALNLGQYPITAVSSITVVGKGLQIGTDLTASASGVLISPTGQIMTIGVGNGSSTPGNRGTGAVDLQTNRTAASQVASGSFAMIGGGQTNTASGGWATVAGGNNNSASNDYAAVAGGQSNYASSIQSTVGGGVSNGATQNYATVGGGYNSTASGVRSTVSGGSQNSASNTDATISGGDHNQANGTYSTVPGGAGNMAQGNYSFAAGYGSTSTANGAFTWSDSQGIGAGNNVQDRTWFKSRGGFLVNGSTNPNMTGTLDRGVLVTGNGLVGISTGAPQAALDVLATGSAATDFAQIWRNSGGSVVSSMSATGVLYPAQPGDNLGSHTATQNLNMSTFKVLGADGSMGAPSFSFGSNTDTGFFLNSTNIAVAIDGNLYWNFGSDRFSSGYSGGPYLAVNGQAAATPAYTFFGDDNTGIFRAEADNLAFTTAGTERVRIDASGNVGIGTTTPGAILDVQGGTSLANTDGKDVYFYAGNGGTGNQDGGSIFLMPGTNTGTGHTPGIVSIGISPATVASAPWLAQNSVYAAGYAYFIGGYISGNNAGFAWGTSSARFYGSGNSDATDFIVYNTNNVARLLIDGSGNVGIGITVPTTSLHVAGATGVTIGEDKTAGTANAAGTLKLIASGDNAYYNTFTSGINTANATYTLPTAMPGANALLKSSSAGVLSWDGSSYLTSYTETDPVVKAISGVVKSNGTTISAAAGTDLNTTFGSQTANYVYAAPSGSAGNPTFRAIVATDIPTLNQTTTGSAAKWTTARTLAGNSVDGSANVSFANKFIVQGTADTGLSGPQFLGALGTGVVKNTTTTGVLSIALGTDLNSTFGSQTANYVYAAPSGSAGSPTFRAIVAADIPNGVFTNAANSFSLINPITTIAESWIGPSSTAGVYFKGGNVGIGTTAPAAPLSIATASGAGASNELLRLTPAGGINTDATGSKLTFYSDVQNGFIEGRRVTAAGPNRALILGSGVTEALRINEAGNVGIGTTAPGSKLHVYGASPTLRIDGSDGTAILRFANAGTEQTQLAVSGGSTYLDYVGDVHFRAGINGGDKVIIQSGGNVGIGTTAPEQKLTVAGNISQTGLIISSGTGDNYFAGDVGIGTATASVPLHIKKITSADLLKLQGYSGGSGADLTNILFANNNNISIGKFSVFQDHPSDNTYSGLRMYLARGGSYFEALRITNSGAVGISNTNPQAALDVVSTGTASNVYAQIWRNSSGVVVASVTSQGTMYATAMGTGDNLGSHTATQNLNMSTYQILAGNGSASAPSYAFTNYTNLGFMANGDGGASFVAGGTPVLSLYGDSWRFPVSSVVLKDSNTGNRVLGFTAGNGTANSATNSVDIKNAATGGNPLISVKGGDANVSLDIASLGTGSVNFTNGNVGIGTTAPSSKLHISSGALTIDGTGGQMNFSGTAGSGNIKPTATAALGGGLTVSTNVYIVGFASATSMYAGNFYGNGSYLTGVSTNIKTCDAYGGGYVVWLDPMKRTPLIVAPADAATTVTWGGSGIAVGATRDAYGAGRANTVMISTTLGSGSYAAQVCADYSVTVNNVYYDDWYLPTYTEIYAAWAVQLGGCSAIGLSLNYWTSKELDATQAKYLTNANGYEGVWGKVVNLGVRCVRGGPAGFDYSRSQADSAVKAVNGIVKSDGTTISAAVAGTDYVAPNAAISGATNTKITYDAKGLVTSGAAATQDDIGDGTTHKQYDPATVAITGGTINGATVGATTASTGKFTTLGLSGAITGATTTNTINSVIINAGAVSGVTSLAMGGALSGVTTLGMSGVLTNTNATASALTLSGANAGIKFSGATGVNQIATASGIALALMPGGAGAVGIGTTAPDQEFTVAGDISQTGVLISSGTGNNYFAGNVGIGTTGPRAQLEVQGNAPGSGILVYDNSTANASPYVEVRGRRSDANGSQSFSGGLALAALYTGGAVPVNKNLGTVYFGGNHTDATEANLLYPASISGIAEGAFTNNTTMPTGIAFYTGATGTALGAANVTFGTERMRISNTGLVGIGASPQSGYQTTIYGVGSNAGLYMSNGSTASNFITVSGFQNAQIALNVTGSVNTNGAVISYTGSGDPQSQITGNYINIAPVRSAGGARTDVDTGNFLRLVRSNSINNASGSLSITGALAYLASGGTQTSGTLSDSSNILDLRQNYAAASGAILNVVGAGTGNLASLDTTNSSANGVYIDVNSASSSQYALRVSANNGAINALNVRADGNVGIGTTAPGAKLHISGGGILLDNNQPLQSYDVGGAARGLIKMGLDDVVYIYNNSGADGGPIVLAPKSGGGEGMRIDSTGNVGIGNSGPASIFAVTPGTLPNGTISTLAGFNGKEVLIQADGQDLNSKTGYWARWTNVGIGAGMTIGRAGAGWGTFIAFHNHGDQTTTLDSSPEAMRIDQAGNVGIGTTAPQAPLHVAGANGTLIETAAGSGFGVYIKVVHAAISTTACSTRCGTNSVCLAAFNDGTGADLLCADATTNVARNCLCALNY